jgi:predicted metal-dependent HD superfamily phosphohydrolase
MVEAGPIIALVPTPSHGEEVPMVDHQSETQWRALWQRIKAQGDPLPSYHDLVQRLAEPHRAYHTMRHIRHCLDEMACVRHLATHPDAVEMALWYHDAIYDTHASDNEAQSATLAAQMLRDASVPETFVAMISRLIMATQHHAVAEDLDTRLLVDIDLAILGQPASIFDAYEQHIRQEYAWVSHAAFLEGRTRILRRFLHRATIYATDHFRQLYEVQARINIARSLRRLEQQV